ncbi:DUF4179 domain-containing protein [Oceanobacillus chungangensis]|uniref:DUF4179 domain-containing protein n=1 Tax=Oceanobacillus chungangensis TaxID=1229152 RepID=A0A3D8PGD1_9BACI|nr:DUF4179 domain-containing protein [Oceanobacillus chungangensis]RDW15150.1 hypothetical protein CWR45_18480 [Oceanobacillus chungangensis]
MKDIYELFNGIEVDTNVKEMSSVSDIEKKKIFKELNHRIGKAKKQSKWKRALSVAIVTFGIITPAIVGLSFTAYAEDIPFLGNIFNFFSSDGSYEGYDENAEKLDLVQESNGIKISINDTVFDGKTLYITYMIETDKDLGDSPSVNSTPVYGDSGLTGSENISRIEEGKYISVMETEHYYSNDLDEVDVNWNIESVSTEANNNGTVYDGNWNFQFKVKAVETQYVALNETIEKGGMTFTADNIAITPMSFILSYQHVATYDIINNWDNQFVEVEVKDDLGNSYKSLSVSGYGNPKFSKNWTATYNKLYPNATKLILTPIIELSDNETIGYYKNGEQIKANYRTMESEADYEEIRLEDITVELK